MKSPDTSTPTRSVSVGVPKNNLAEHVQDLTRMFVDSERAARQVELDNVLTNRLGDSYEAVALLVARLNQSQREIAQLRKENKRLRCPEVPERPSTPVSASA